jgi:hypothetical protein
MCNCGADAGEALKLKTESRQYWPLVEIATVISGNGVESVTRPLS